MGLARGAIALLLEEAARQPFSGRIATLGKQTLYASNREIESQFERFGFAPACAVDWAGPALDDVQLYRACGFESTDSFDYSDFEGADFVVDLNRPGMPPETVGAYDAVLDSGTLEHVFHVPNALENVISLLKVGGRVIFLSPSSNHLDHGFYMFSPTFFVDYFLANKFEINTCYVVRYSPHLDRLWDAYAYDTERWRDLHIGGLDDQPYAIFFVATRTEASTAGAVPQQGYYADSAAFYAGARLAGDAGEAGQDAEAGTWTGSQAPGAPVRSAGRSVGASLRSLAGRALRRVPPAYRLVQRARLLVQKRHLNKTLVGRY